MLYHLTRTCTKALLSEVLVLFIYCSICLSSHLTVIFFSLSKWKISFSHWGQFTHWIRKGEQERELWEREAGSQRLGRLSQPFPPCAPYTVSLCSILFYSTGHQPLYIYFWISLLPVSLWALQGRNFVFIAVFPAHRTVLGVYDVLSKCLLKFKRF